MDNKVRENRLRRMAERQGLTLTKNRRRDPRALDYGEYRLQGKRCANLDEVEALLTGDRLPKNAARVPAKKVGARR
jgi:hypothetical protein